MIIILLSISTFQIISNELVDEPTEEWLRKSSYETWEEFSFLYEHIEKLNQDYDDLKLEYGKLKAAFNELEIITNNAEKDIKVKQRKKIIKSGFSIGVSAAADLKYKPHVNVISTGCFIFFDSLILSPGVIIQTYPNFQIGGILSIGGVF